MRSKGSNVSDGSGKGWTGLKCQNSAELPSGLAPKGETRGAGKNGQHISDGTKIKANASGNTFRRKEPHLALAREQVRRMNERQRRKRKQPNVNPLPSAVRPGTGQSPGGGVS